jgi:hypothetical protein
MQNYHFVEQQTGLGPFDNLTPGNKKRLQVGVVASLIQEVNQVIDDIMSYQLDLLSFLRLCPACS